MGDTFRRGGVLVLYNGTLVFFLITYFTLGYTKRTSIRKDSVNYKRAQNEFLKKNYKASAIFYKKYLGNFKSKIQEEKVFEAFDSFARIYLREYQDLFAIKFYLSRLKKLERVSESQLDFLQEWDFAISEWSKRIHIKAVKKSGFEEGKGFYEEGIFLQTFRNTRSSTLLIAGG